MNYYNIDPWHNPYTVFHTDDEGTLYKKNLAILEKDEEMPRLTEDPVDPVVPVVLVNDQCAPLYDGYTSIRVCDDHIVI